MASVAYRAKVPPWAVVLNAALLQKFPPSQKSPMTFFNHVPKNLNFAFVPPPLVGSAPYPFGAADLFLVIYPHIFSFSPPLWKCRPLGSAARGDSPPALHLGTLGLLYSLKPIRIVDLMIYSHASLIALNCFDCIISY